MKILISGHTKGIGQAIASHFSAKNYQVSGYSRTNNRDLSLPSNQTDFAYESLDSDIIIINANIGFHTVDLLYKVFEKIAGLDKTIVVLGSRRTEVLTNFPMKYQ